MSTVVQAFEETNLRCNESALNGHIVPKIGRVDQIITCEEGVFLLIDGFWLGSQGMQATPEGILVLEDSEWISLEEAIRCDNYYVWQCRSCRAWNPQGTFKCSRCKTPR